MPNSTGEQAKPNGSNPTALTKGGPLPDARQAGAKEAEVARPEDTAPAEGATPQGAETEAEASGGPEPQQATAGEITKVGVLGHALWLMTQSPTHKHLFVADMEWLLIPPVSLGQFRIWRRKNLPLAFASWAFLTDEAADRLKIGAQRLAPRDWNAGGQLWLMDMIAPFGGAEEAAKELKAQVFKGRTVKTLQPAADGKSMTVIEW